MRKDIEKKMSEKDKDLHELFREKLKGFEPEYNPDHWVQMKGRIDMGGFSGNGSSSGFGVSSGIIKSFGWLITVPVVVGLYFAVKNSSSNEIKIASEMVATDTVKTEHVANENEHTIDDAKKFAEAIEPLAQTEKNKPVKRLIKEEVYEEVVYARAEKKDIAKYEIKSDRAILVPMKYGYPDHERDLASIIESQDVVRIELVYTDHPDGRIFEGLNKNRIGTLESLLPGLKSNNNIEWSLLRQTGARTKSQAESYFHGFVIHLKNKTPDSKSNMDSGSTNSRASISFLSPKNFNELNSEPLNFDTYLVELKIRNELMNRLISEDSTTYKVLDRNIEKWKNAVVVCDWTTSMFKYGTQVMTWLSEHEGADNIKGFVFFNDCDVDGMPLKESDKKGGMYYTSSTNTGKVFKTMVKAIRKGSKNEDLVENDAEAIAFAYEQFPDVDEIILIADNVSPVRNLKFIADLPKPVKIIVCGTTLKDEVAIQPHYFTIARRTNGSIHTIEDDLEDVKRIKEETWIKIGERYFVYKDMKFRPTKRKKRPKGK
ncbi:hypothetical protein QQ008_16080 [Fulvivirgaceae bacterium BMA10]|uniref:VWA domain-containing protein n=1 Tax=Splendidivirga corallicola TaxID=3051826 RepID=A0ABT8KQ84_9BACT|nr:hypothetical protein [Fulvivirgaceae bacterium BMA10]